ncbi:MAG TPA: DEAD/DEAH box helicase, partial [Candidatus Paceibacterota bacterium]
MKLSDPLSSVFRLSDAHKSALAKLGIKTIRDLLFYFPFRYEQAGGEAAVAGLVLGTEASIIGVLEKMETKKSWKSRTPVSEGYLRDATGRIKLRWFNQPYIAKMYLDGTRVRAVGKVSGSEGKLYLANPQLQKVSIAEAEHMQTLQLEAEAPQEQAMEKSGSASASDAGRGPRTFSESAAEKPADLFAMYPESRGVTSLWFRHAIAKIMAGGIIEEAKDPIPPGILKRYNLPTLTTALVWAHTPEKIKDAEAARKRFAFEEVFMIQLERARERKQQAREKSFEVDAPKKDIDAFVATFPFTVTRAQQRAIESILDDMRSGHPMSRLLEGDVGSGKTAVAATAAYAAVRTRPEGQTFGTLQVAYMAPTEILAKQHFESFIKYFETFPVNIGLITGSGCFKFPSKIGRGASTSISRAQLLKW